MLFRTFLVSAIMATQTIDCRLSVRRTIWERFERTQCFSKSTKRPRSEDLQSKKSSDSDRLVVGHPAYDILFLLFNHTEINIEHLSLNSMFGSILGQFWSLSGHFCPSSMSRDSADDQMNSFLYIISSGWILATFDLKSERNEIETDQSEGQIF